MFRWISLFVITVVVSLFAFQPNTGESKPESPKFKTVWTPKFALSYWKPVDDRYFTKLIMASEHTPENAIAELPAGYATNQRLLPGEIMTSEHIKEQDPRSHVCTYIPDGMKVIAIRSSNVDEKTGIRIGESEHIDVIGRYDQIKNGIAFKGESIVANDVIVFSIGRNFTKSKSKGTIIGLLVAHEDAETVFEAQKNNWQLSMTLHRD
jgi:hypothetical protein